MTTSTANPRSRPHVVVIGGGFAGLSAVRALDGTAADVTLIDRHTYATFKPLLYQVATATLNPGDITWFLRAVRSRQHNVRFLNGAVRRMDHSARTVTLEDETRVSYDHLVIAAGVTANYFGIPGAAEHAMPLYTRNDALEFRDKMVQQLERAAISDPSRELRVIVVGGGPTGVETAGALAELRNKDLPANYPELDRYHTHVTLMEMMPNLLGGFVPSLQRYTLDQLVARDVDVQVDTAVKEVRADGVLDSDENFIPAGLVVWASGVTVHDVVGDWGVPQGRGGRISIDDRMRVQGLDNVFAIGDIAVEDGDRALPQLAQPAMQQGKYVGRLLAAEIGSERGRQPSAPKGPFHYQDRGMLATIGRSSAVAQIKHFPPIKGFVAWVIWMAVHLFYLLGNRNRVATMVNLGARYLFWRSGHNAIVGDRPPRPREDPDTPR